MKMALEKFSIKISNSHDFNDIMTVEKLAFGYDKEAKLVADLLNDKTSKLTLSLLAYHEEKPIGHILFTSVCFKDQPTSPIMHLLAPLAVIPDYQRQGVGGLLINTGLEMLKEMGSKIVFVLGHKEYYPKYGFLPCAGELGFAAPYPIPPENSEYWMVQAISPEGLTLGRGTIQCADGLNKPEHWRE